MVNSRDKGIRFERKIAKAFSESLGLDIRRTPLSGGWAKGSAEVAGDLVCVDNPDDFPYHVECKCSEGWKLESLFTDQHKWFDDWWEQCVTECPEGKIPLLVFTRNYTPEFVALKFPDWDTIDFEMIEGPIMDLRWLEYSIVIMLLNDFIKQTV